MSPRPRDSKRCHSGCLVQGSRRNALRNGRKQQKVWRGATCLTRLEATGLNSNNNRLIELGIAAASDPSSNTNTKIVHPTRRVRLPPPQHPAADRPAPHTTTAQPWPIAMKPRRSMRERERSFLDGASFSHVRRTEPASCRCHASDWQARQGARRTAFRQHSSDPWANVARLLQHDDDSRPSMRAVHVIFLGRQRMSLQAR
jgi:hypothetical protein